MTYRKRRFASMLKDKELRKTIGSRAKSRRQELGLNQPYVAEKMGVTASTIQRYEAGTIDNTDVYKRQSLHITFEFGPEISNEPSSCAYAKKI